ncbi:sirohydrochlorin chelatase [Alicyclobacillus fastidiosus]|uniref:Sirohydrochlorin chelatase n=1 Tax=Alicyclobacillus fastidiosus TaxID=392011 RepID=A0ABV5AER7_9BACL|nr:sirohydrochlorin chelatase [Alicyclobacillus fastidiosus]WEH09511.1 sirohydrochlorin chelatase [Alicyclobacillus fastidiosus]
MKEITLCIGHGSRDDDGNLEFVQFVDRVREAAPDRHFEVAFLELTTPTIADGIDRCVQAGATRIVAIPIILLAASHIKLEIPEMLDQARAKYPDVEIVYGRNIGLHERMIDLLTDRYVQQMEQSNWAAARPEDTAIVVMGRGSSDPDANGDLYKIARQVWERTGVKTVEVCFTGVTFPRLPAGVHRAVALDVKHLVVLPYFLFTGVLIKRMREVLASLQTKHPQVKMAMAEYFGMHPYLVEVALSRQEEAVAGQAFMNCDLCKYRKLGEHHHHDHHDHAIVGQNG